jgi:HlyD family secretion protein
VKNGDVLCTIANTSTMKLILAIDELDIAKVRTGQKASITCDALPETATKPLEGIVTAVALEGTSSNGVSTYPVTISFPSVEGLKVGMNANADILVDHKENVLMLPIEAVQTVNGISIVMVPGTGTQADRSQWGSSSPNSMRAGQGTSGQKRASQAQSGQQGSYSQGQSGQQRPDQSQSGNLAQRRALQGSSQQSEYYKNTVPKKVETGISNETHIEIISGLNEGDQVILPPVTTGQSSTTQQTQGGGANPFGGMGGNRIMGGGNR